MPTKFPPPHSSDDFRNLLDVEPDATLEFMADRDGILGGIHDVVAFLQMQQLQHMQAWSIEQGSTIRRGDVALRVRGHFVEYGRYAGALAGILATQSGWATATRALLNAAKPLPIVFAGSVVVHPALAAQLQTIAVEGGCLPPDSQIGQGIVTHTLILLAGDTLRAVRMLEKRVAPEIPRLVYVDTFHDPTDEAARVALALGDKLYGVVLQDQGAEQALAASLLQRIRSQLELAGFPRVKIFVGGDVTVEKILNWREQQAPLDGYLVGNAIALAPPLPFTVELRECDGKPLARRGQTPGTTPSPRLQRIGLT